MKLLGSYERETFSEIKPHLVSKYASNSSAGSVRLINSVLHNVLEKIVVCLHVLNDLRPKFTKPFINGGIFSH